MIAPYPDRGERGVVLANALALVVMVAAISAALIARSEASRERHLSVEARTALQINLDALSDLSQQLLEAPGADGSVVHSGQTWAAPVHRFAMGHSIGEIAINDLQGRLNLNWLAQPDDTFAQSAFAHLFDTLGLSPVLLRGIQDFIHTRGPSGVHVSDASRAGPMATVDALRAVAGITADDFDRLAPHVAALPLDSRINLNTASTPVLRAILHPLPAEVRRYVETARKEGPIEHLSTLRDATVAVLETEDIGHLPFDRFALSSRWFQADLLTEANGVTAERRVVLNRAAVTDPRPAFVMRWALRP